MISSSKLITSMVFTTISMQYHVHGSEEVYPKNIIGNNYHGAVPVSQVDPKFKEAHPFGWGPYTSELEEKYDNHPNLVLAPMPHLLKIVMRNMNHMPNRDVYPHIMANQEDYANKLKKEDMKLQGRFELVQITSSDTFAEAIRDRTDGLFFGVSEIRGRAFLFIYWKTIKKIFCLCHMNEFSDPVEVTQMPAIDYLFVAEDSFWKLRGIWKGKESYKLVEFMNRSDEDLLNEDKNAEIQTYLNGIGTNVVFLRWKNDGQQTYYKMSIDGATQFVAIKKDKKESKMTYTDRHGRIKEYATIKFRSRWERVFEAIDGIEEVHTTDDGTVRADISVPMIKIVRDGKRCGCKAKKFQKKECILLGKETADFKKTFSKNHKCTNVQSSDDYLEMLKNAGEGYYVQRIKEDRGTMKRYKYTNELLLKMDDMWFYCSNNVNKKQTVWNGVHWKEVKNFGCYPIIYVPTCNLKLNHSYDQDDFLKICKETFKIAEIELEIELNNELIREGNEDMHFTRRRFKPRCSYVKIIKFKDGQYKVRTKSGKRTIEAHYRQRGWHVMGAPSAGKNKQRKLWSSGGKRTNPFIVRPGMVTWDKKLKH